GEFSLFFDKHRTTSAVKGFGMFLACPKWPVWEFCIPGSENSRRVAVNTAHGSWADSRVGQRNLRRAAMKKTLGRDRCRFPGRNSVHGRRIPVRPQPLVPAQLPPPPSSRRGLTPEFGTPGGSVPCVRWGCRGSVHGGIFGGRDTL